MSLDASHKIVLTPFAKKVYRIVAQIPVGQVRSYRWVARKAGRPRASRAVGQVLKRNPWPVLIPCHRVIRSDATMGGYAKGLKRKTRLLRKEQGIRACLASKK